MKNRKILVTGGAGYIGSHTAVALLEAGWEPIIIDNFSRSSRLVIKGIEKIVRQKIKVYAIDCNNEKALEKVFKNEKTIAGAIHFAAYKSVEESVQHPLIYYKNNINSLSTVLTQLMKHDASYFIFSSSCTVYGQPNSLPVTEHSPLLYPTSPYGHTKQIGEQMIDYSIQSKSYPIHAASLRYFNPIGAHPSSYIGELPLNKPSNLVPFVTQTGAGIRKKLTVFGDNYTTPDGTCIRDYIHIMDLAEAHVETLNWLTTKKQKLSYDVFNIGTGKGTSVLEIIHNFENISGKKLPYVIGPRRDGDIDMIYASVEKAKKILKWKAKRTITEALKDAWNWELSLKSLKLNP